MKLIYFISSLFIIIILAWVITYLNIWSKLKFYDWLILMFILLAIILNFFDKGGHNKNLT